MIMLYASMSSQFEMSLLAILVQHSNSLSSATKICDYCSNPLVRGMPEEVVEVTAFSGYQWFHLGRIIVQVGCMEHPVLAAL